MKQVCGDWTLCATLRYSTSATYRFQAELLRANRGDTDLGYIFFKHCTVGFAGCS